MHRRNLHITRRQVCAGEKTSFLPLITGFSNVERTFRPSPDTHLDLRVSGVSDQQIGVSDKSWPSNRRCRLRLMLLLMFRVVLLLAIDGWISMVYPRSLFVDIFKQSSNIENGRNDSFVIGFVYSQLFESTRLPFIRYHNNTVPKFSLKSSLKYTNYHFFVKTLSIWLPWQKRTKVVISPVRQTVTIFLWK